MRKDIEEEYFIWLCAQIDTDGSRRPFWRWNLYNDLHRYEFVWVVQGDANRAADGLALREEFLSMTGYPPDIFDDVGTEPQVSVFEVLIALTKHAAYQTGWTRQEWFVRFLENLHLSPWYEGDAGHTEDIQKILYNFVWRLYNFNGRGGLFPIRRPPEDQRHVELWFQFFEYIESEAIGR